LSGLHVFAVVKKENTEKATPIVRWVRKAAGLVKETAEPPVTTLLVVSVAFCLKQVCFLAGENIKEYLAVSTEHNIR